MPHRTDDRAAREITPTDADLPLKESIPKVDEVSSLHCQNDGPKYNIFDKQNQISGPEDQTLDSDSHISDTESQKTDTKGKKTNTEGQVPDPAIYKRKHDVQKVSSFW